MKRILFLILFLPVAVLGQVDNTIDKGTGILYFSGEPGTVPDTSATSYQSEIAWDLIGEVLYYFSRDSMKWSEYSSGSGGDVDLSFNSNRTILRELSAGVNIGGSTITDVLEYMYFTPPTITLNRSPSTYVYEVGTSNSITYSGATTNSGAAILSGGNLKILPNTTMTTFGDALSYSYGYTFAPTSLTLVQFDVFQDWMKGAESGTASAAALTTYSAHPVFYGVSSTDLSASGDIYGTLSKLVTLEGDKAVNMDGTGFIYYAIPASWTDNVINQILDHNGFNVTGSFTVYDRTVSSSGLTNDYSNVNYKLYQLNNQTTANNNVYQFNQ